MSAAKPKIADYPFTTLHPQLGVVGIDGREFVLADIPGLIEGAHLGAGLGDRFLGHVERCRVLLHLVDGTADDVGDAYKTVRAELDAYGHGLSEKPEVVALNNSFHGRTFGALSITGQEKYRRDFEPLVAGAKFVPANDITALEQVVNERTAGIVMEWIQGEGGIFPMTTEYARKARELADRYDALLAFDEIQCGVGRPGKYFAYQLADPIVLPNPAPK